VKHEGISTIMSLGTCDVLTITLKDSPIKKMTDLKGKRVGIGAPGSFSTIMNKLTISGWDLYDLKTGDIKINPEYLSFAEITTNLKDRRIDAGMYTITGRPGPAIVDLALTHDIRILNYEEEIVAKLEKLYPFGARTIYPKGLYRGVDYDVLVIEFQDILICRKQLPEDLMYKITKLIDENLPYLQKTGYHGFKYVKLTRKVEGMFPLHPGAKKYYDEKNIK
jgi:TRAP transporter TAXI family solute receptor